MLLDQCMFLGKLRTYPFPNLTFCPKREVSVNVRFGEGWVGSFQKHTLIRALHPSPILSRQRTSLIILIVFDLLIWIAFLFAIVYIPCNLESDFWSYIICKLLPRKGRVFCLRNYGILYSFHSSYTPEISFDLPLDSILELLVLWFHRLWQLM